MATQAEEVAKIAAERLFEAARDGDVAAVSCLATAGAGRDRRAAARTAYH